MQTNNEINQAATKEWTEVLVRLWDAIDKPVDVKRLQNYYRELGGVPFGLLEASVSRCIRENTYTNIPSIGKVWEAVRKELGDPYDIDQGIENWKETRFQKCFYRFGETQ
jgi:hypothetical protein